MAAGRGHFRGEYRTEEGEAPRDEEDFACLAAREHIGAGECRLRKEPLAFESVRLAARGYKWGWR